VCAIAGYVRVGASETSSARLLAALHAMRHRGPDDEGLALIHPRSGASQRLLTPNSDPALRDGSRAGSVAELAHAVGFGHGRFSIIDPSPDGHQPFWSEDGAVCAMFNGEIYNYLELRRDLQQLGRRFRTASDAEVLVAAYQQWGTACFPKLNGFFALSLWDAGPGPHREGAALRLAGRYGPFLGVGAEGVVQFERSRGGTNQPADARRVRRAEQEGHRRRDLLRGRHVVSARLPWLDRAGRIDPA
jgi:hypothetical protein